MPYLALKEVTVTNVNDESAIHLPGTVLSDWEVNDFVKGKIAEGSVHYRSLYEPLTNAEALHHRAKATAVEGDHWVDGQFVSPPWDDYVGLHPEEIIERLKAATSRDVCAQVKLYERGGLNRQVIIDYVAPAERPPFIGYDEMPVREVLEKLALVSADAVQEVISYEMAHRKRPAIITYERAAFEGDDEDTTEVTA